MKIPYQALLEVIAYMATGAVCVVPLLLLNVRVAKRLGLIDWPKARGLADDQVPIVGHSLIVASLIACLVLISFYKLSPWFLTTAVIMGVMGYFDDRKALPAVDKIFFQLFCVCSVVLLDPQIHDAVYVPYGVAGTLLMMLFMMGLINAINFIDGIDGLAGLVIFCGALGFSLMSYRSLANYPYFVYSSLLAGMIGPFLFVNVVRRRGFLGNVGSYFFSYALAVMHASLPLPAPSMLSRLSIAGLCFVVPLADAVVVITIRLWTARSPFQADKGHLHHRLVQSNVPLRNILAVFGLSELMATSIAVLLARRAAVVGYLPVFICLSHIAIVALLVLLLESASRRRIQSYFQRIDEQKPVYFVKYQLVRNDGATIDPLVLRRVEARIGAEIRVSDLCYAEAPDRIVVTLASSPEPLKGVSARIENILQSESLAARVVIEQGEFVKVMKSHPNFPIRRAG